MPFHVLLKETRKSLKLTQEKMGAMLGISGNWVSLLETGDESKAKPSRMLMDAVVRIASDMGSHLPDMPVPPSVYENRTRQVPVIGWAHAGEITNYEEIPDDWREWAETDCRDAKAFAVRIEGESMSGPYLPGDVLILSPANEIYSGCLAVIKMKSDGFVFRQVERRIDHLKLIPLNPRWESEEMPLSEVEWAYPVYAMFRQVWKK